MTKLDTTEYKAIYNQKFAQSDYNVGMNTNLLKISHGLVRYTKNVVLNDRVIELPAMSTSNDKHLWGL